MLRTAALTLLAAAAVSAYPDKWLTSQNGGCGILISERNGDSGMAGAGYSEEGDKETTVQAKTGDKVPIPLQLSSGDAGYFVTASSNNGDVELSHEGASSKGSCSDHFVYEMGKSGKVFFKATTAGTYQVEVGHARGYGKVINFYKVTIEIDADSPSPTKTPSGDDPCNAYKFPKRCEKEGVCEWKKMAKKGKKCQAKATAPKACTEYKMKKMCNNNDGCAWKPKRKKGQKCQAKVTAPKKACTEYKMRKMCDNNDGCAWKPKRKKGQKCQPREV